MPDKLVGIGASFQRRKPRWVNLRREILEIFVEAQVYSIEKASRMRAFTQTKAAQLHRPGFNCKKREQAFYAMQKAKYSHFKIVPVAPPADLKLLCSCGYQAHTREQLNAHAYNRHKKSQDNR